MKRIVLLCVLATSICFAEGPAPPEPVERPAISSRVETTEAGGRTLIEELVVEAPVSEVWDAYTTREGWTSWAAPKAEVDLRPGGTIRTHYAPGAEIGDPGTIVLHIVNYVPRRILTLRADPQENWPEAMKRDADHLMNVIVFEPLSDSRTRLTSYGVGYGAAPEYDQLLGFFAEANKGLYGKLIEYVEAD